jgi:hypothetical protein
VDFILTGRRNATWPFFIIMTILTGDQPRSVHGLHDANRATREKKGVRILSLCALWRRLSLHLFHRFSSAPDPSLIFLESLEYLYLAILINSNIELLISILSECFRCSNESNRKEKCNNTPIESTRRQSDQNIKALDDDRTRTSRH